MCVSVCELSQQTKTELKVGGMSSGWVSTCWNIYFCELCVPQTHNSQKRFDFFAVLLSHWKHFHVLRILFVHILDIFLPILFFSIFCLSSNYYF